MVVTEGQFDRLIVVEISIFRLSGLVPENGSKADGCIGEALAQYEQKYWHLSNFVMLKSM